MDYGKLFDSCERQGLSLALGDLTLGTGYADFDPDEVSLSTMFSRNVTLGIPIVSAAMDTVTEAPLATAIAQAGGIGIIHRNLLPVAQAEEVQRVKYYSISGLIKNPVTVFSDETVAAVLRRREEKRYSFHSFLVLDREAGKLVGVFTRQDLEFCENYSCKISKVMTQYPITAPAGTSVADASSKLREHKIKLLPLINENGEVAGLYTMKDVKRAASKDAFPENVDTSGRLCVAAAIGIRGPGTDTEERVQRLVDEHVDALVVDMAHGDSRGVIDTIKWIKRAYNVDVVAGNISEKASAKRLCEAGADGIRVGQGPGSTCTTGLVTGTGVPLATAIHNCAEAAEWYGIPVGADGGMRYPGDIVKAIGVRAWYAVLGNMLAGTDEAPGEIIYLNGATWKEHRGMGSLGAMKTRTGSRERYQHSEYLVKAPPVPEGLEGRVLYKGPVAAVIQQIIGGIRKGMFNAGTRTIAELRKNAILHRRTSAGEASTHPNIEITEEAPNYSSMQNAA